MKIEGYACHYGDYYKNHVTPHFNTPQYEINKGAFMKGIAAREKVPVFLVDKEPIFENIVGHATLFQRKDGIYCEVETIETFQYEKDALYNMQLGFWAVRVEKDENDIINDGMIRSVYFTPCGYEPILSIKE